MSQSQIAVPTSEPTDPSDPERDTVVAEEQGALDKVVDHLAKRVLKPKPRVVDYDSQLISLRDQIAAARLEDVPPLVEQMERLATLASRQRSKSQGFIDPDSPYFGRLVLAENGRTREVLIGRSTYLDAKSAVRIVDWRDAPVSRLFYRFEEGEDYCETFGDREVEGEVRTRRSLAITEGQLRRVVAPQGTFVRDREEVWHRTGSSTKLHGGQGVALRAEHHHRPGKLGGAGFESDREDKSLQEITALIDPRQFELITKPDSGLVVIQGGAGSGKTTIGLHRLAYLAFQDQRRFRPDRMLIVVFNHALARYVARVLPALGVRGVAVRTYEEWASKLRLVHLNNLPKNYSDDTPSSVTKLKKHPLMLDAMDARVKAISSQIEAALLEALGDASEDASHALRQRWAGSAGRPLVHRIHGIGRWVRDEGKRLPGSARLNIEGAVGRNLAWARDVVTVWADLISDLPALQQLFEQHAPDAFTTAELKRAHAWCAKHCGRALDDIEAKEHDDDEPKQKDSGPSEDGYGRGIDGGDLEEKATMDREDDTLLLSLIQRMRGPLMRGTKGKDALVYEHILVDEAQDLSPVELAVVAGTVSRSQSITLAGDVAQRLHMDNGFTSWSETLGKIGLSHVEVEPLKLSYRSTSQIVEFARHVLGPLAPADSPDAIREGAPIELFRFAHSGDAVGFLGEALRELMRDEPNASVALVARFTEHADTYYQGLARAEVPNLRRIAEQDFPFKPGIDVTDVRQVKGLEFDYVILVEVSDAVFPVDDEARHLLHIAATRAAHQLWIVSSGNPSRLLPDNLRDRGY